MNTTKYIVVGAGFFGAVIAERIANDMKENVTLIERRNHIGGNSYSEVEKTTGIEYHKYGSHIFHTSNQKVWKYLNKFTHFNNYRHKVLTTYQNNIFQMPVNLETINKFFQKKFTPLQAKSFILQQIKDDIADNNQVKNFEEMAISKIGKSLYNAFFQGYTSKQWGTDLSLLPIEIAERLPVRYNYKTDYFDDFWQGVPTDGYTKMFGNMLNSERINVQLGIDFFDIKSKISKNSIVIYSGPIDRFYDYKYGHLDWRSLKFDYEIMKTKDFQGTAVMNFADIEVPYTRIHEFKHLHDELIFKTESTIICREYPLQWHKGEEPYYPLNTCKNQKLLKKYQMKKNKHTIFGGRLGTYKYLDMDDVVEQALDIYETKIKNH